MENEQKNNKKTNRPDFISNKGTAVWSGKTKEGKDMLAIKIDGHEYIYAFRNENKNNEVKE